MNFDWTHSYPSIRLPLYARNAVATSQPLAAQAGLQMLWQGGNAADAAIAAAAALTIVEPVSNGLGSDAFALVWDGSRLHGLNASGPAPAAWRLDDFLRRHDPSASNGPRRGWDSVTVPGAIAGWHTLHSRYGRLPFADVLQPAITLAERGVGVPYVIARKWAAAVPGLRQFPDFAQTFMPRGRAPEVGETFLMPEAAATLRRLASAGPRDFYEGDLAERIVAHSAAGGGALTLADLRGYQPEWVEPISRSYRGYDVHEIPPNGQGIAALIALGLLERFDLSASPPDSGAGAHLQIEAMKLAFADVYRYVADPRSMDLSPADMLDDGYLDQRAKLIDPRHASQVEAGRPAAGGTVYLTAADEDGMMISFIQSNYMGFGSGIVVPGTGISLQNRGAGFSLDPASANALEGGKRPFHTIIPGFLTQNGTPIMSFGVMGGDMQPQGHVQTVVRTIDHRQQPQAACDAPRWKVNHDYSVDLEASMAADTVQDLRARGHVLRSVEDPYMDFGAGQYIWRLDDGGYLAASDSRRDGQAVGF